MQTLGLFVGAISRHAHDLKCCMLYVLGPEGQTSTTRFINLVAFTAVLFGSVWLACMLIWHQVLFLKCNYAVIFEMVSRDCRCTYSASET